MTNTEQERCAVVSMAGAYPTLLPSRALKLARRALHVMSQQDAVDLQVFKIDGVWYLRVNGGSMEKLGH